MSFSHQNDGALLSLFFLDMYMIYSPTFISILEVLLVVVPVLFVISLVAFAERQNMLLPQRGLASNMLHYYSFSWAFAHAFKLIIKKYISPIQANIVLFFIGPVITLIFSLLGYAMIPYAPGLAISNFNLGILYMVAVSLLVIYGILLAGWSANSKYAQLISYELILSPAILFIIFLGDGLKSIREVYLKDIIDYVKHVYRHFMWMFGIMCEVHKINLSIHHFGKTIIVSTVLRSFAFSLYILCPYIGIDTSLVLNFFSGLIIILLIISYKLSNNKIQFFINLGFIICFWRIGSYFINLIPAVFILDFLTNYNCIQLEFFNTPFPEDLKNALETVSLNLDKIISPVLSEYFNGSPDDKVGDSFLFPYESDTFTDLHKYYSKPFWSLDQKYYDFKNASHIIEAYNKEIVHYDLDIKNILASNLAGQRMAHYFIQYPAFVDNIENFNSFLLFQTACLWEIDVLPKAKLYHNGSSMFSIFKILPLSKSHCESTYNFWLNRQIEYVSFFRLVNNNFSITNFTNTEVYYREVCENLIWVKFNLILSHSFWSYDAPVIYKILNFNNIINKLLETLYLEHEQELRSIWKCCKVQYMDHNKTLMNFVYAGNIDYDLSIWDRNHPCQGIGLGLSHKFAFSNFHVDTLYKLHNFGETKMDTVTTSTTILGVDSYHKKFNLRSFYGY